MWPEVKLKTALAKIDFVLWGGISTEWLLTNVLIGNDQIFPNHDKLRHICSGSY